MPKSIWEPEVQQTINNAKHNRFEKTVVVDGQSVKVPSPFPSPDDWRDAAPIYEIMVDRFNNPHALKVNNNTDLFQGGTLEGIRQKLDYLKDLGVKAIWLSPILKNCQYDKSSYHGYGIQDFLSVEPRFVSNKKNPEGELQALIDEAHARGIYVIFDIVLNHVGSVFSYSINKKVFDQYPPENPANSKLPDESYDILWHDKEGHPNITDPSKNDDPDAGVWPKELRNNNSFLRRGTKSGDTGDTGGDFGNLKQFHWKYNPNPQALQELRNTLIRIHQYLIAKFDIDGFRIDTFRFIDLDTAHIFGNAIREFAESIGKKNFFTFGEIWGGRSIEENEEIIRRFLGSNTDSSHDELIGVEASLDFPLFDCLPGALKGFKPPQEVARMFEERKNLLKGVIDSHGEASKFFVTFLDNHDLSERFYYSDDHKYDAQLTLGIACLFSLQGIPCLYYGTEQGLNGCSHDLKFHDLAVRQVLWGKPGGGFNTDHPFYKAIKELSSIRENLPALRYGRQYFRPISGNGIDFRISSYYAGVLAFSRILDETEVVVVANTNTTTSITVDVIVDYALNAGRVGARPTYRIKFSNQSSNTSYSVEHKNKVKIVEVDGRKTHGPLRCIKVTLQPMEVQILTK